MKTRHPQLPEDVRRMLYQLGGEADSLVLKLDSTLPLEDIGRDLLLAYVQDVSNTLEWLTTGDGPGPEGFDMGPWRIADGAETP